MSHKPMLIGSLESQAQREEMPSSRNFGQPVFRKRNSYARFAMPRPRVRMCLPPKLPHVVSQVCDPIGDIDVPVRFGNTEQWWIFDTGANVSTISLGNAQRLGLTLSKGKRNQDKALVGFRDSLYASSPRPNWASDSRTAAVVEPTPRRKRSGDSKNLPGTTVVSN